MATTAALFAQVQSTLPLSSSPAPLPVLKPLPSYWLDNYDSPLSTRGSDSALPDEVDIVIIGSGLTGTSALRFLVEKWEGLGNGKKAKIVVLEAREFCSGATGTLFHILAIQPVRTLLFRRA